MDNFSNARTHLRCHHHDDPFFSCWFISSAPTSHKFLTFQFNFTLRVRIFFLPFFFVAQIKILIFLLILFMYLRIIFSYVYTEKKSYERKVI